MANPSASGHIAGAHSFCEVAFCGGVQHEEREMYFIERAFGISPDGGDGSTEFLWIATLLIAVISIVTWHFVRRKTSRK